MYFVVDSLEQRATCHKSKGDAARAALNLLEVEVEKGMHVVKVLSETEQDRLSILNLTGAFQSIIDSDNETKDFMATIYRDAIEEFYYQR